MSELRFDLCILGAGPAGYAAAMRAHDLGRKVLLIERDRIGGAGIHAGALSSKTMWHLANDDDKARCTTRGYRAEKLRVSYGAVMAEVERAVVERRELLERQLAHLANPSPGGGQVTLCRGDGRFLSPHCVEVRGGDGTVERFQADHFLLATGSRPRLPKDIPVDGDLVVTSDHIERWDHFPRSLVVIGAGVIGCEYATIFANFGATKIYLIDQQPRILPFEDDDVAEVIAGNFEAMGVTIHQGCKLTSLRLVDGQVEYVVCSDSGVCEPIRVERALVAIGRVPNLEELNLEAAGVLRGPGGALLGDAPGTTAKHIYAAGDTTTDVALANVAELEGRHAVEQMFGLAPRAIRFEAISSIMFLKPEVAVVGLNEQQAKRGGIPYRVGLVRNQLINRNIAMRATAGFVKLLAAPDGRLLGARVVGPHASSAVQGVALLIDRGGTLDDLDHCIHSHPSVTEGVQEAARLLLGRSVHKPEVFGGELLRCDD